MKPLPALFAIAAFAVAAPAFAQPQQQQPSPGQARAGVMEACGPQINQLCGNVQAGKGRLVRCLKSNFQELTPQCKGRLAEAYAIREEEQP